MLDGVDRTGLPGDPVTAVERARLDATDEFHSVGIGRFRLQGNILVCVDGQQRVKYARLYSTNIFRTKITGIAEMIN